MKSLVLGLVFGTLAGASSLAGAQTYSTMKLAHSGKCVDVNAASSQNEVQLQQWGCNKTVAQDFQFIAQPNGTYEIRTRTGKNLCVDVQAGSGANFTRIQQYACNGSPAQRFSLQARDGGYSIRPVVNQQSCLDLNNNGPNDGDKLIEYACNGGKNQLFQINLAGSTTQPAPSPAPAPAPSVDAKAFGVSSPTDGGTVSGTITVKGVTGSNWKNVAAYDAARNYAKVAADVTPKDNAFSLSIDTTKIADGDFKLAVIAFSVAAGGTGGTSQAVTLNLKVSNAAVVPTPAPTPTPTPAPVVQRPTPIAGSEFANFQVTFEDTFTSLSTISLGSQWNGAKWYNGTKQCCMVDSNNLPAVMFPTAVNGVQVNPYTMLPNGGGLGISLDKKNNVWYSGILTTVDANQQGFKQQYGYFEMRAKMPTGDGVWPAFWMLSTDPNMPGEIDIFEYYGHDQGTTFGITLHDWRNGGNNSNIAAANKSFFPKVSGMTTDFHDYGMLWTESTLTFFFDGRQVWQAPTPDVMKNPYYILINNGLGGYWPTDKTPDHSVLEVQYVRAYGPK